MNQTVNSVSDILSLAFFKGGKVFGGYLRDTIAGEDLSDVDVFFPDKEKAIGFILRLSEKMPISLETKESRYHYSQWKVQNSIINIDVVGGFPWSLVEGIKLDFDVNTLVYDGVNLSVGIPNGGTVLGIIDNIKVKCCKRLPGCTDKRLEKMLAKGWTLV